MTVRGFLAGMMGALMPAVCVAAWGDYVTGTLVETFRPLYLVAMLVAPLWAACLCIPLFGIACYGAAAGGWASRIVPALCGLHACVLLAFAGFSFGGVRLGDISRFHIYVVMASYVLFALFALVLYLFFVRHWPRALLSALALVLAGLFFSPWMILILPVSEVVFLVLGIAVCRDLVRLADSRRCVATT